MSLSISYIANDSLKVKTDGDVSVVGEVNVNQLSESSVKMWDPGNENIKLAPDETKEVFRFLTKANQKEFIVALASGGTNQAQGLEIHFEGAHDPSTANVANKAFNAITTVCHMNDLDLGAVLGGMNATNQDNKRTRFMEDYKPIIAGDVWRILIKNTSTSEKGINRVVCRIR